MLLREHSNRRKISSIFRFRLSRQIRSVVYDNRGSTSPLVLPTLECEGRTQRVDPEATASLLYFSLPILPGSYLRISSSVVIRNRGTNAEGAEGALRTVREG
jgi:hypothetical protein